MTGALVQAARRVLGADARIGTEAVSIDPPDAESVKKGRDGDGVVEVSFSSDGSRAKIHCYLGRERRWLDREIGFGETQGSARSEANERGRMLGFAIATMFSEDSVEELTEEPTAAAPPAALEKTAPVRFTAPPTAEQRPTVSEPTPWSRGRSIEFAGIASTGLNGTAAGLGASAGLRLALAGPLWSRLFIAGRAGNIPQAQASTRMLFMGVGLALALLPAAARLELGVRADLGAGYFDAAHLSEDDVQPDRRSRWQLGADLVAEAGARISGTTHAFVGFGVEGMLGKTEIYTHGNRVAVVAPVRATAEVGFRTGF